MGAVEVAVDQLKTYNEMLDATADDKEKYEQTYMIREDFMKRKQSLLELENAAKDFKEDVKKLRKYINIQEALGKKLKVEEKEKELNRSFLDFNKIKEEKEKELLGEKK